MCSKSRAFFLNFACCLSLWAIGILGQDPTIQAINLTLPGPSPTTSSELEDTSTLGQTYYYCHGPEEGTVIACSCSIEWFHTSCLQMLTLPKGKAKCRLQEVTTISEKEKELITFTVKATISQDNVSR